MNRLFNNIQILDFLERASQKRGAIFGSILIGALLSFEVFNFGTTSFALQDILGDLTFAGVRWSTMLALAFCGIDFAGIARIFTPEQGRDEPAEVWYLFGAWLLAAGFNASLTWWGVSIAILNHNAAGTALVGESAMATVMPIMVAGMVWLIRVLIIGTFSVAGERLFTLENARPQNNYYRNTTQAPARVNQPFNMNQPAQANQSFSMSQNQPAQNNYPRPAPKPRPVAPNPSYVNRPEPTYHPVGMTAMSRNNNNSATRR